MNADPFAGAWRLVEGSFVRNDGKVVHPVGPRAAGQLLYDGRGHMNGQMMGLDRPAFASGNRLRGTDAEVRAAFEGYIAYWGRYSIDAAAGTVTHHVEGSLSPEWVGTDQVRHFAFDGDRLTLRTDPIPSGDGLHYVGTLIWERVPDA
ncbi:MAG: lipocalin-like domain-containing protein [Planctomycetota bacterium]|nr:lipocalin-like domain-containing protein [Planctomycetota bacterium]